MTLNFKRIVSFARKRSNNPKKEAEILAKLLPKFAAITPEDGGALEKISDLFKGSEKEYSTYAMEIGFGSGENILHDAKTNPSIGYIGCEVYTGGVVKLLNSIDNDDIKNIRIWHDDAVELIARLPLNSLNFVSILYPDPWPKTKHNKRRLINAEFLKLLSTKMAPDSKLLMVTDHKDYADHITKELPEVSDIFARQMNNYPEITKTKYRLKAEDKGIESNYFYLVKK